MPPRHEQSVADYFNRGMEAAAKRLGFAFESFSLGGQDANVGADYVITDSMEFSLIEFKYSESELRNEGNKPKREVLCEKLSKNRRMKPLHDKGHFVSWLDTATGKTMCNVYRFEICNKAIFPSASLVRTLPMRARRVSAETFCNEFFGKIPPRALNKDEFEEYLGWLMSKTSDSSIETVELLLRDDRGGTFGLLRAESLSGIYAWLDSKYNVSLSKNSSSRPRP